MSQAPVFGESFGEVVIRNWTLFRRLPPLECSIRKWRFIVRYVSRTGTYIRDGGPSTCALCRKFDPDSLSSSCGKCPVRKRTKKDACRDTPYDAYAYAYCFRRSRAQVLEAAKAELKFLLSLKKRKRKPC